LKSGPKLSEGLGAPYSNSYIRPSPPTSRVKDFFGTNHLGGHWVIKALANKYKLKRPRTPAIIMDFDSVRMVPFDGCAFFTNKQCASGGLFVRDEFEKETFTSIDNVLATNNSLAAMGIQAIWLVVPDKSTVYLGYGKEDTHPYVNIWDELERHPALVAPNLGRLFMRQSRLTKDFYFPNNTHLSTSGYLYLGDITAKLLKRLNDTNPTKR
ncbi:MAG: hypothetical protein Q7N50_07385, partial [Armatimonadota bacterium]|nr:hypothetical protein [Armatimonadota bacterium]